MSSEQHRDVDFARPPCLQAANNQIVDKRISYAALKVTFNLDPLRATKAEVEQ